MMYLQKQESLQIDVSISGLAAEQSTCRPGYYRECPNCSTPHIASHRSRFFCSDWCADTYYNNNRRNVKQGGAMIAERGAAIPTAGIGPSPVQQMSIPAPPVDPLACNLTILDKMGIDMINGTYCLIDDLVRSSFAFDHFTGRVKLNNTRQGEDCYALEYRNYIIFFIDKQGVLISKTK